MKTLADNKNYYFYDKLTFKSSLDNAHFFIMKDYSIGMHVQDFLEINIIIRGIGEHYIENNCIKAYPGDVFFIPPNICHGYVGGNGFDVFHILISNSFMHKNTSDLQALPGFFVLFKVEPLMRTKSDNTLYLKLNSVQLEIVKKLLDVALCHNNYYDKADSVTRTGFLMIIISLICSMYKENNADSNDNSNNYNNELFMKAVAMIHEKYYEKLTIDMLAKTAHMSRTAFIRKFVDVCKMPPAEYIIQKRLEVSKNMLITTVSPISEIANRTGFYDSTHFTKIFTSRIGISPGRYREKQKHFK